MMLNDEILPALQARMQVKLNGLIRQQNKRQESLGLIAIVFSVDGVEIHAHEDNELNEKQLAMLRNHIERNLLQLKRELLRGGNDAPFVNSIVLDHTERGLAIRIGALSQAKKTKVK